MLSLILMLYFLLHYFHLLFLHNKSFHSLSYRIPPFLPINRPKHLPCPVYLCVHGLRIHLQPSRNFSRRLLLIKVQAGDPVVWRLQSFAPLPKRFTRTPLQSLALRRFTPCRLPVQYLRFLRLRSVFRRSQIINAAVRCDPAQPSLLRSRRSIRMVPERRQERILRQVLCCKIISCHLVADRKYQILILIYPL